MTKQELVQLKLQEFLAAVCDKSKNDILKQSIIKEGQLSGIEFARPEKMENLITKFSNEIADIEAGLDLSNESSKNGILRYRDGVAPPSRQCEAPYSDLLEIESEILPNNIIKKEFSVNLGDVKIHMDDETREEIESFIKRTRLKNKKDDPGVSDEKTKP